MVYSFVTDSEREINTLSGGESFMAALSLALGMADEIKESAAGIDLDIMFIDEGFGSLDDHSRDEAVKVLMDMSEGTKLIGIISHVSELKQEIEDQLVVSKDDNGSHVKCRSAKKDCRMIYTYGIMSVRGKYNEKYYYTKRCIRYRY